MSIVKGNTIAPAPTQRDLAPKPMIVDKANASPAASMNAITEQATQQNMANNMRGGWIPMGSNAYNIDQVNAVVNQNPHNTSIGRRRLRRRERRMLRNMHNRGPRPHDQTQYRGTAKRFGGRRTARCRNRSRFTRSRRYRTRAPLNAVQRRISHRVRMNLLHRKIHKFKNNYTQRGGEGPTTAVPQHGASCAGGAAQQNCPGNSTASLLDAQRQATANAQGDINPTV